MQKQIIQITDTTDKVVKTYILKNKNWNFDRLKKKFVELNPKIRINEDWRGYFDEFKKFIEARGAMEIQLPIINLPNFPDPDWND